MDIEAVNDKPQGQFDEINELEKAKIERVKERQKKKLERQKMRAEEQKKRGHQDEEAFYCNNNDLLEELIKWRDSSDVIENRVISERLGEMFMAIGKKLLNHSNFRNYPQELKEDMLGYFFYKIIRGLKNYNFEFTNPFAFVTMAAWNAYLTIISKHYKQINIKKDLMKKMSVELETYNGISPNTSLNKFIKTYLGEDFY